MEFNFETVHDTYALTVMAKVLRKLYRKKKSIFYRIFCLLFVAFGVYTSTPLSGREFSFSPSAALCYMTLALVLIAAFFEDTINGFFAQKRMSSAREEINAVFNEEGYSLESAIDVTHWNYKDVNQLVIKKSYFLIVFNSKYAQIFDMYNLSGGTEEEFCAFVEEKTGKKIIRM